MHGAESPGDDAGCPAQFISPNRSVAAADGGASDTGRNLLFGLLAFRTTSSIETH